METKRGRPPKPPGEALAERIDLRITTAEKADYESAASRAGQSLSEWMRERLNKAAKRESKQD